MSQVRNYVTHRRQNDENFEKLHKKINFMSQVRNDVTEGVYKMTENCQNGRKLTNILTKNAQISQVSTQSPSRHKKAYIKMA